jgi:hypothetical protein
MRKKTFINLRKLIKYSKKKLFLAKTAERKPLLAFTLFIFEKEFNFHLMLWNIY